MIKNSSAESLLLIAAANELKAQVSDVESARLNEKFGEKFG